MCAASLSYYITQCSAAIHLPSPVSPLLSSPLLSLVTAVLACSTELTHLWPVIKRYISTLMEQATEHTTCKQNLKELLMLIG